MSRTLSLSVSALVLVLAGGLPATDPPPVAHDESGVAWDIKVQEDGTRSLRVGCLPGRRYTIEQSADSPNGRPSGRGPA